MPSVQTPLPPPPQRALLQFEEIPGRPLFVVWGVSIIEAECTSQGEDSLHECKDCGSWKNVAKKKKNETRSAKTSRRITNSIKYIEIINNNHKTSQLHLPSFIMATRLKWKLLENEKKKKKKKKIKRKKKKKKKKKRKYKIDQKLHQTSSSDSIQTF